MKLKEIIQLLDTWAPNLYQEEYDNSGLLVGNQDAELTKAIITLDCTTDVVEEAIQEGAQLVIAHHPIVFSGLKKLTGRTYVERAILLAIRHDIAIYAIHTNLDNIASGVNAMICEKIGLKKTSILVPKKSILKKLITFIPKDSFDKVTQALFEAGAGSIGNYRECGFSSEGIGSFLGNEQTQPHIGQTNTLEKVKEIKFETIFPIHLESSIIKTLIQTHPYEEVAYDIIPLNNSHPEIGSGMIGELEQEMDFKEFLAMIKARFNLKALKYTPLNRPVRHVAVCGGSGSFLRWDAARRGADVFISSDFKYHEYFDTEDKLSYLDIGHYESEQFTSELIYRYLAKNALSLQTQISKVNTNPINYFI